MLRVDKGKNLRWGFSTGASMSALALCAWHNLQTRGILNQVDVYFLDDMTRSIPLLPFVELEKELEKEISGNRGINLENFTYKTANNINSSELIALRKDGGDDPDCTHRALFYGTLSACSLEDARQEDHILYIDESSATDRGVLIIRCIEGIGLCTRAGLDCEQGKWAISLGPRKMLVENLFRAKFHGIYILQIGVRNGEKLAKNTLNPLLGVVNGISLLGTTGLVRPYSHEAYLHTVRVCVKSHALSCGTEMVFCTGGRTKTGAENYLNTLPETAFTCIGDFIAESLKLACQYGMESITVACMAGKLCKYVAGFSNTHAHKVQQDMDLLRSELRACLTQNKTDIGSTDFCDALENAPTVREALLYIPEDIRLPLLKQLAEKALLQFTNWTGKLPCLRLLVFDFDGTFLFESKLSGDKNAKPLWEYIDLEHDDMSDDMSFGEISSEDLKSQENRESLIDSKQIVHKNYFIHKSEIV